MVLPIAVFLFGTEAFACSCESSPYSDAKERLLHDLSLSDVAFEGIVTGIEGNAVKFSVTQCVKGECGTSLVVHDGMAGTSCETGLADYSSIAQKFWVAVRKGESRDSYSFSPCSGFIIKSKKVSE
jgi:hypothetical protein